MGIWQSAIANSRKIPPGCGEFRGRGAFFNDLRRFLPGMTLAHYPAQNVEISLPEKRSS
jgi:hypothetical protein